ncbi:hypothetical protein [Nonomuraea sp. 10N515B]|uniref:hypothetical protein n=1 Tax=Nonomuraea sp. 10N515B TaxID=3457422 RepID=UPI003FCDAAFC
MAKKSKQREKVDFFCMLTMFALAIGLLGWVVSGHVPMIPWQAAAGAVAMTTVALVLSVIRLRRVFATGA